MTHVPERQKTAVDDTGTEMKGQDPDQKGTMSKAPGSISTGRAVHKIPNMLKEIAPSRADPQITQPARVNNVLGLINDGAIFMTRSSTRGLMKLARGKSLSPTKNYNLRDMVKKQEMLEAQPKIKKDVDHRKSTRSYATEARMPQKVSQSMAVNNKRKNMASPRSSCEEENDDTVSSPDVITDHGDNLSMEDADRSKQELDLYQAKKAEIVKRLLAPCYKLPSPKALQPPDVPDGFNMHMEKSVFVFKPGAGVLSDFVHFLEVVEDIAGRTQGVVKVVLPTSTDTTTWGCPSPSRDTTAEDIRVERATNESSNNRTGLLSIESCQTQLVAHKFPRSDITFAYGIDTCNGKHVLASVWRDMIEAHRKETSRAWSMDIDQEGGIWKEVMYEYTYQEKDMIGALAKPVIHALDIEAKQDIRAALRCNEIGLENSAHNSIFKSRLRIPAIHSSHFQVTKTSGAVFGLHMDEYAAYLLSVLHVGPPRSWVVVKPAHHARLEEILLNVLRGDMRSANLGDYQYIDLPQCSQFIKHESIYLPVEFLESHGIEYTLVIQHQSEMVITFPFAYHQEFDTGPNINESMLYASQRWEQFIGHGLHVPCSDRCPDSPVDVEFSLGKQSRKSPSKRLRGRTPIPIQHLSKRAAMGQGTPRPRQVEIHSATVDLEDGLHDDGEMGRTNRQHAESKLDGGVRKKRRLVRREQA